MTHPTTPIRAAKLCFLTQPELGTFLLNLQFEGQPGISRGLDTFERVELTCEQLRGLAIDAVGMALGRGLE